MVRQLIQQGADVAPGQISHSRGEINSAGHAAAKARMYCRFVANSPVIDGNSRRRSAASCLITPDPKGSVFLLAQDQLADPPTDCRTRSEFAVRATCSLVVRTSVVMRARSS